MSKSNNKQSRRKFIKTAAVGAAAAGLVTGLPASAESKEVKEATPIATSKFDVVIIGGGVAGCYAAYRLATATTSTVDSNSPLYSIIQKNGKLNVGLFEYSGRIGGRLLSVAIPGLQKPGQPANGETEYFAEFGGFRFHRTMQIVWNTAEFLGLTDEVFHFNDHDHTDFIHVRGTQFMWADVQAGKGLYPLYNISEFEQQLVTGTWDYTDLCPDPYTGPVKGTGQGSGPDALTNYISNVVFAGSGGLPNSSSCKEGYPPDGLTTLQANFQTAFANATQYEDALKTLNAGGTLDPNLQKVLYYKLNVNSIPDLKMALPDAITTEWNAVIAGSNAYEKAKANVKPFGRPLYDWSWWAIKRQVLSQEAVALLEDTTGYNEEGFFGGAAANIDEDFYFIAQDGYGPTIGRWRHITEGYSAIPAGLNAKFKKVYPSQTNNNTFLSHQLVSFNKAATGGGYDLLFYNRRNEPGPGGVKSSVAAENICKNDPNSKECLNVNAKFIVLAIPVRSLELLDQNNFFFQNETVQHLLYHDAESDVPRISKIPAIRLFMAYHKPWWAQEGGYSVMNYSPPDTKVYKCQLPPPEMPVYPPTKGRTTTDLGVRQYYYWWTPPNPSYANQNGVFLASYASGAGEQYWRTLQAGQPYDALAGSARDVTVPQAPQHGGPRSASKAMAETAHYQLLTANGVPADNIDNIPLPYYAHYQNWTKDPWGAGWHAWKAGSDQQVLIPLVRQPISTEQVYIAGEAYSDVQGWVQGALNMTEALLQCNLGLKWPSFLHKLGTWLGPGTKWLTPADVLAGNVNPCVDGPFKSS